MNDELKKLPKDRPNPIFKGLSNYVKDPANFKEIQKEILNTLAVGHSHSEMLDYAKCAECTRKMKDRRTLLKKYGFKNPAQYMAWRKVHEEITKRYPLMDWKKKAIITPYV